MYFSTRLKHIINCKAESSIGAKAISVASLGELHALP